MLRALERVGDDERDRLPGVVHDVVLQREEALPGAAWPSSDGSSCGAPTIRPSVRWSSTASTPSARRAASASIAVTRPEAIVAPTIASSTVPGGASSAV